MTLSPAWPLAYRWFRSRHLTDWEPWYFLDPDQPPDRHAFAHAAFRAETGADFEVRLFARRQDQDDYAFFVVEGGAVRDRVYTVHLSFSGRRERRQPLALADVTQTFAEWIRTVVVPDVADWMTEEDLPLRDTD